MTHHLTICFASQRNQWQANFMANNAGTFRRKGRVLVLWVTKPEICTRFDRYWYGRFWGGFLALSFDFLHFIHGSAFGFSMKIERLITEEKKVNFTCISTSSAVTATPYIFWGKLCGKNWQGVMIGHTDKITLVQKLNQWVGFSIQFCNEISVAC